MRLPSEFVELAHAFRDSVQRIDHQCEAALAVITKPLRERLRRHPKLRREHVPDTVRLYERTMPVAFRIGKIVELLGPQELVLAEQRITVSRLTDATWARPGLERGVSVANFSLIARDGRVIEHWAPIACVSMHALVRRIERDDRRRDHAALVTDLATLVEAEDEAGDRVRCAGGWWLGEVITANDETSRRPIKLRNVRTFVPDDG